ncbi:PEP-CTERM sorting domain-containing protein [Aquabacterium sp.]|uniref:PEP-CTERM sorting domain-containing protein n=1 Tax=Aquabacterium sp. TaxID=1872578 RepID=UPI002D7F2BD3|nr:PEP-CTERM sorting domain-containing protein [Aquabacterium sp.]
MMSALPSRLLAAVLFAAALPAAQAADNLISNGSFESGSTGWTLIGDATLSSSDAYDGTVSSLLQDVSGSGAAVTTSFSAIAVSEIAELSLWLRNADLGPLSLVVFGYSSGSTGSTVLEDFGNPDWTQFSLLSSLDSSQSLVSLTVYGGTGSASYVDDVLLTRISSAVPEPHSAALFAAGLIGVASLIRRRMQA